MEDNGSIAEETGGTLVGGKIQIKKAAVVISRMVLLGGARVGRTQC